MALENSGVPLASPRVIWRPSSPSEHLALLRGLLDNGLRLVRPQNKQDLQQPKGGIVRRLQVDFTWCVLACQPFPICVYLIRGVSGVS